MEAMMTRLFVAAAAIAAVLALAGPAGAQARHPHLPYPAVTIPPIDPYPADTGAAIGSDVTCEPPGLPPSLGALPPSTHPCR
jgi:hypothetical protein